MVYFEDGLRLYIYDTKTNALTYRMCDFPILSLRVFRGSLIIRNVLGFDYIGPCLLEYLPCELDIKSCYLIPYDEGFVVHRWGEGRKNYLFGTWVEGEFIQQFLKLPDHNYVAQHVFDVAFYVQTKQVYAVKLDFVIRNCFLVKDRLFCFSHNKLVIIG